MRKVALGVLLLSLTSCFYDLPERSEEPTTVHVTTRSISVHHRFDSPFQPPKPLLIRKRTFVANVPELNPSFDSP